MNMLRLKRLEAKPSSLYEKYALLSPFTDEHFGEFEKQELYLARTHGMTIEEWLISPLEIERIKAAIGLKMTAEQWVILRPYSHTR